MLAVVQDLAAADVSIRQHTSAHVYISIPVLAVAQDLAAAESIAQIIRFIHAYFERSMRTHI